MGNDRLCTVEKLPCSLPPSILTTTSSFVVWIFWLALSVTWTSTGSLIAPDLPRGPSNTRPATPYLTVTCPGAISHSRAVLVISPRCLMARLSPTRPIWIDGQLRVILPDGNTRTAASAPCLHSWSHLICRHGERAFLRKHGAIDGSGGLFWTGATKHTAKLCHRAAARHQAKSPDKQYSRDNRNRFHVCFRKDPAPSFPLLTAVLLLSDCNMLAMITYYGYANLNNPHYLTKLTFLLRSTYYQLACARKPPKDDFPTPI